MVYEKNNKLNKTNNEFKKLILNIINHNRFDNNQYYETSLKFLPLITI